jgi:prolyl 4-hydroxylase
MDDASLLDSLSDYAQTSPTREPAVTRYGVTNAQVKESWDCLLDHTPLLYKQYRDQLQQVVDLYIAQYPYSNRQKPFDLEWPVLCQHYPVAGGYKVWHCERATAGKDSARHLVFMTYLNDLADGGTEFLHQNITVPAERGLTLIWPCDWTFTHRSQVSQTSEKMVVTGWLRYV